MTPDIITKMRFFEVGKEAPKNSAFKGKVTAASIFGDIYGNGTGGSKFDYDRRFVSLFETDDDSPSLFDDRDSSLAGYTSRFTDEDKTNYTFTSMGFLDTQEKVDTFRQIGYNINDKEGAVIWECILSLKDVTTADRYGMYSQKQLAMALEPVIERFFRHNGFEPNNMMFWMDYHENESKKGEIHPHIHLQFFEIEKQRTKGVFSKKVMDDFKRDFAIELAKRDKDNDLYHNILSKGDEYKKELIEEIKITEFKKIKDVTDLYKILPKTGRLQYNSYQLKPYREVIDKTIDTLLNSEPLKEQYNRFVEQLEKYDALINEKAGHEVSTHKADELQKLRERVGNIILQNKKDDNSRYVKRKSYYSIVRTDMRTIKELIRTSAGINEIATVYKQVYNTLITNLPKLSAYDLSTLARLEYEGNGTNKNTNLAIQHLNLAISKLDNDDIYGQCRYNTLLSSMYFDIGDSEKGIECLQNAIDLGDAKAEFLLGLREVTGDGVSKNVEEGIYKISNASEKGDRSAAKWLRSNGYTSSGQVRYRSQSRFPVGFAKNNTAKHRKILRQLSYHIEQQDREIQYAIQQYLRDAERSGQEYEYTKES